MPFIEYKKIKRLGHEETDGILDTEVHVQEKIDGANVSLWMEDGEMKMASRTRVLTEGFNGFCEYVMAHKGIERLIVAYPNYRLYGEWLVRHTVAYDETAYKQFYLFDIMDADGKMLETWKVNELADACGINRPKYFGFMKTTQEELEKLVGQSDLGKEGEGVVIKNPTFINKFGDWQYAKIVSQKFKEDNAIVFGGNNKHSDTYNEMYVVNKYMTLERIQKIMAKIQPLEEKRLDKEHTGRIIQTAYHDLFVEEMWEIAKKFGKMDFKTLESLCVRKARKIYHDILDGHMSVAYTGNVESPTDL